MSNLVQTIKRIAVEAVEASQPTGLVIGVVTSASPLQILVDQRLNLDEDFLILTNLVTDHYVNCELEGSTEGCKKALLHYGLKRGESVMMVKMQGGQKYIVLDRLGDVPTEGSE